MNNLLSKKRNELTRKKKGFTLIELIIVIAIIAILAAIAIPKFGAAKHNADVATDQANAKIIATAVSQAVAEDISDVYNSSGTVDTSKITNYIDGGVIPVPRAGGSFTVSYSDASGVTVSAGGAQVYPIQSSNSSGSN